MRSITQRLLEKKANITAGDLYQMLKCTHIPLTDKRQSVSRGQKVETRAFGAVVHQVTKDVYICKEKEEKSKQYENVIRILCRFMQQKNPSFKFSTIQINKNYAAAPHRDGNNRGPSALIALGDFEGGGELEVEVEVEAVASWRTRLTVERLSAKNRLVYFDGNNKHWVSSWKKGTRYSVVFFTIGNYRTFAPDVMERLRLLGFPIDLS